MKKSVVAMTLLLLSALVFNTQAAHAILNDTQEEQHGETNEAIKNVKLTKEQQEELAGLSQEILMKKKELVSKYVEFGVLSEEKGEKVIKKMEEHYQKLESNGFIPQWKKSKKHKHRD